VRREPCDASGVKSLEEGNPGGQRPRSVGNTMAEVTDPHREQGLEGDAQAGAGLVFVREGVNIKKALGPRGLQGSVRGKGPEGKTPRALPA